MPCIRPRRSRWVSQLPIRSDLLRHLEAEPAQPGQPMQATSGNGNACSGQDSHSCCGSDWFGRLVPIADCGRLLIWMGPALAVLSDWPRNLDVRRSLGLRWFPAKFLFADSPEKQLCRPGRVGYRGISFASRGHERSALAPNLASAASCHRHNQAVGEQDATAANDAARIRADGHHNQRCPSRSNSGSSN